MACSRRDGETERRTSSAPQSAGCPVGAGAPQVLPPSPPNIVDLYVSPRPAASKTPSATLEGPARSHCLSVSLGLTLFFSYSALQACSPPQPKKAEASVLCFCLCLSLTHSHFFTRSLFSLSLRLCFSLLPRGLQPAVAQRFRRRRSALRVPSATICHSFAPMMCRRTG